MQPKHKKLSALQPGKRGTDSSAIYGETRSISLLWWSVVLSVFASCWLGDGALAQAKDTWTQPYKGIRRLHRQTSNQNINVLIIDLCAPGVSLRATASSERRRTVSSFGSSVGAQAAINGDFFSFSNYSTNGLSMHNGSAWSGTKDHSYVAPIAIGSKRIEIPHHNNINNPQSWMKEVVSGHPTILDDGNHVGNPSDPLCTSRHPRTAVGISKDHKTMIWAVVDGRASSRIGMTCKELSALVKSFGAWDAVNMDGGGSSTMWVRSAGVVNRPSDGRERVVANHLAVRAPGSGTPAHCPCSPACQGSKIIGSDCGVGDCAAFGATCVDDRLGVRCVSVFCPAIGKKKVCVNDKLIGDCDNGGIKTGDCSMFAAYCSTAGVSEARCVSAFCVSGPKEVPKVHDICLPDGRLAHCNAAGSATKAQHCPSGQVCKVHEGKAQCLPKNQPTEPPPARETTPGREKPLPESTQESTQEYLAEDSGITSESLSEPAEHFQENVSLEHSTDPEKSGEPPEVMVEKRSSGEVLVLYVDSELRPPDRGCGCDGIAAGMSGWLWVWVGLILLCIRRL